MEERRTVGTMNGTAITNRLQNSFKITCTDHRIIEILGLRSSNRLSVSCYALRCYDAFECIECLMVGCAMSIVKHFMHIQDKKQIPQYLQIFQWNIIHHHKLVNNIQY